MHDHRNERRGPASDLPGVDSSPSLRAVDDERAKARSWNGYVCPGCRTVFRVAGDFSGADVICPSCHETLRLPKAPGDPPPLTVPSAPPPAAMAEAAPQMPDRDDGGESAFASLFATSEGRTKLALAFLIPLAVIAAGLVLFPNDKVVPSGVSAMNPVKPQPEPQIPVASPDRAPPPPPPVAVSEKSRAVDGVSPESIKPPAVPEIVASEELPELPPAAQPEAGLASGAPGVLPSAGIAGEMPALDPEQGLVAAVPEAPMPVEKIPTPPAAPSSPPAPAEDSNPAGKPERSHTVVKGDNLTRIARKYQVEPRAIMQANGMKSDVVRLGRKLVIPAER